MIEPTDKNFWSLSNEELFKTFETSTEGLSSSEARVRLDQFGYNDIQPRTERNDFITFLKQFNSPITMLLIISAILSFFSSDEVDASIILTILIISGALSFFQERSASHAVKELLAMVSSNISCYRDSKKIELPADELVLGDIIELSAGSVIPADCVILHANNLFLDEASLTGETFPLEKFSQIVPKDTPMNKRSNYLYMGTHVISGTGTGLVVSTGLDTEFGKISKHLKLKPSQNEFEKGISHFGYVLTRMVLILVVIIFFINVELKRSVLNSILFSLAIAVSLTPQLLPVIIAINLAQGSKQMAHKKVIVKKLTSIENFGSMNILCTDKTGTITEGIMTINSNVNFEGKISNKTLFYSFINASLQTGYENPIDTCIQNETTGFTLDGVKKIDEIPYDFIRKRITLTVDQNNTRIMITKGAVEQILEICSRVELDESTQARSEMSKHSNDLKNEYLKLSNSGLRTIAIAYKILSPNESYEKENEKDMTFLGFLTFKDPPKENIIEVIQTLEKYGVKLYIISGDNQFVAMSIAKEIGLPELNLLTGPQIAKLSDEALIHLVNRTNIYAEVEPNQKERIILALKKAGNVVGYMGDGINDATALHTADVGISVNNAVTIAKESADIVLLEKNMDVLVNGMSEGRRTFANTLKYILISISGNFSNMISMAIASLVLPFFPLLPEQVLSINLLTDLPSTTISTDNVDDELINAPRRWNLQFIMKFMVFFGVISTFIDLIFFTIFRGILHADAINFQSSWFFMSIMNQLLIVLVIRTRRTFFKSNPSKQMILAIVVIFILDFILPLQPLAQILNITVVPLWWYPIMFILTAFYVIITEIQKRVFYKFVSI